MYLPVTASVTFLSRPCRCDRRTIATCCGPGPRCRWSTRSCRSSSVSTSRSMPGVAQRFGDQVDALDVVHRDDALHRHVGVHRDLLADLLLHRVGGAAGDDVRHDADFHQPLDAELGGLGFLLAERAGLEDVGQGDEDDRVLRLLRTRAGGRLRGRSCSRSRRRCRRLRRRRRRRCVLAASSRSLSFTSPVTCGMTCTSRPR